MPLPRAQRVLVTTFLAVLAACGGGGGGGSEPAQEPVATPTFSPDGGSFAAAQQVTLTSATPGAIIHYATGDGVPSASAGTMYTDPITLSATTTLRAIAVKPGRAPSLVVERTFTIEPPQPQVAAPAFTPAGGLYATGPQVTLHTDTTGATIRYTTNGTAPSATVGTIYTGPIAVNASTTLRAIAYRAGMTASDVTSRSYTITSRVAMPVYSPDVEYFTPPLYVTITCPTAGSVLHYTTDGSVPSGTADELYTGPVRLDGTTMVAALASAGTTLSPIIWKRYVAGAPPPVSILGASIMTATDQLGAQQWITIRYHNGTTSDMETVFVQTWVDQAQNQAWRPAGGWTVGVDRGSGTWVLPPGDHTETTQFYVGNDLSGEGTLTPGPAVLRIQLMRGFSPDDQIIQVYEVPFTIVD